jgi:predicted  nucleic acid-binding Zn-ribbon protein
MSGNSNTTAERIKLEMLETLVKGISEKLQKAEVLNGGFDRLQEDMSLLRENVSEIRSELCKVNVELSNFKEQNIDFKKDLARIDEAIYHPDNGIYKRIHRSSDHEELREQKLDRALEKINTVEKMIEPLDDTEKKLKRIAGDELQELNTIVKTRQNIDRIFWILITAVIGGGAKVIWDMISAIN